MEKKIEIQEMWFNNLDHEVTLYGKLHKGFLQYDTKAKLPISKLNHLINLIKKRNDQFDFYDHMCTFNLGFVTEYHVTIPSHVNCIFSQEEILGERDTYFKQVRA